MRRMRGFLNSLARALAVLIMATAPLCAAQAADLMHARVWAGPQYTRVVLDMSGPLDYQVRRDGTQMVVDLGDSRIADGFFDPSAQGLYRGMSHRIEGNRLKLVASVAADSQLKSFVLKPTSGSDYRLVLDLYPGHDQPASGVADAAPTPVAELPAMPDNRKPIIVPRLGSRAHSSLAITQQAAALLNGQRKVVVAIDAGHGGKDQGAHGPGGTLEKTSRWRWRATWRR
jgi:N-acetylmuramoyl-L-alanine amidase